MREENNIYCSRYHRSIILQYSNNYHSYCVYYEWIIQHVGRPTFSLNLCYCFSFSFVYCIDNQFGGYVVVAVTNQKGGVGKTTTAVNVAAALAFHGKRVLLVDTDSQAHSTKSLVVDAEKCPHSLFDALMSPQQVPLSDVIMKSTVPGFDVAVSRISMAKLEPSLLGQIDGHFRLKEDTGTGARALQFYFHRYASDTRAYYFEFACCGHASLDSDSIVFPLPGRNR